MSARNSQLRMLGTSSGRRKAAGAVIACAVMLLAACGGSGGSAVETEKPAIRGDVDVLYAVGDTGPGQGKVFYVSTAEFAMTGSPCGTSCHYLEAQTDLIGPMAWCDVSELVLPQTSNVFGSGYSNTEAIANGCTSGPGRAAWDSTSGDVSDWFLPSMQELKALFLQRDSVGGPDDGTAYWSSTQYDETWAWNASIDWNTGITPKTTSLLARAVRAF